jgi:hypothetical protein
VRRLRRATAGLGLLVLACAVAAGCGDDSDEGTQGVAGAAGQLEDLVESKSPPAFPAGRWQGRLAQRGLKPFQIRVTIRSRDDRSANPVHYTGIDCGGNWTYLGIRGEDLRFREVIDRGKGGECKGAGIVTLRYVSADRLRYQFRGGGVSSSGFLRPAD